MIPRAAGVAPSCVVRKIGRSGKMMSLDVSFRNAAMPRSTTCGGTRYLAVASLIHLLECILFISRLRDFANARFDFAARANREIAKSRNREISEEFIHGGNQDRRGPRDRKSVVEGEG